MILRIIESLFPCKHGNPFFPQSGWQSCASCGARRRYQIGAEPGPWITDVEVLRSAEEIQEAMRASFEARF
jgi:hypothetical protein